MLAPYAFRVEESRGRRYPEPKHPYRNDFQRDRDRVVHSRAFRRLENKTQVFTRRVSDHFRNRLTHTIEVTQISRTIAAEMGLNEDLAEALALVHDVGHPPFGHAGEHQLNELMAGYGEGFDHNLHALRIVEQFEQRYADFPGLNLTFEVREGIVKHSRDYEDSRFPELAEYLLELRPPLEAQLVDFADEIAYSTADLDDGVEAGILTWQQVRREVPVFSQLYAEVAELYPEAPEKLLFNETLKRVMDKLVSDLITNTDKLVADAAVASVEQVRRSPHRLFAFSPEGDLERRQLKEFLYENLYCSPASKSDKEDGELMIAELFSFYIKFPDQLPDGYRERTKAEPLHRTVCDYIAGMTDNFIREQHGRFCKGSRKAGV